MKKKRVPRKELNDFSPLEEAILPRINALSDEFRILRPTRSQCYLPPTKLEFDFAWPELKIAIEVQGGLHRRGGHTTAAGIKRDMYKMCIAQSKGWILYQIPPDWCKCGNHFKILRGLLIRAFQLRGVQK